MGSLFANAAEFDPFRALMLLSGGKPEPVADTYALNEYLCGMGARSHIEKHGLAEFRAFVNRSRRTMLGRSLGAYATSFRAMEGSPRLI